MSKTGKIGKEILAKKKEEKNKEETKKSTKKSKKSTKSMTKEDKKNDDRFILNPASGRYVLKSGKVGKEILAKN